MGTVVSAESGIGQGYGEQIKVNAFVIGSSYNIVHRKGIHSENPERLEEIQSNLQSSPMARSCRFEIEYEADLVHIECKKHSVVNDESNIVEQLEIDRKELFNSGIGYYFKNKESF